MGKQSIHEEAGEDTQFHSLWRVAREFGPYLKPYKLAVVGAALLIILQVALSVLEPWPLKLIIDHVLKSKPINLSETIPEWVGLEHLTAWLSSLDHSSLLNTLCLLMVAISLLAGLFAYLANSRITSIGQHITYDIRRNLFHHISKLSLPFYEDQRSGDIVTRVNGDISNMQDFMISFVNVLLVNAMMVLGVAIMMFRVDVPFTLISLGVIPVLYFVMRYFIANIKISQRKGRRKLGEIASVVQEFVSSIKLVQAFAREDHEKAKFDELSRSALRAGLRTTELQSRFAPSVDVITAFSTTIIILYGARRVSLDEMTLGTLILFISYLRILHNPIKQLAKLVNVQSKASISAERIAEILDTPAGISDSPHALEAKTFIGNVEFKDVGFSYPPRLGSVEPASVVLENINLKVKAGMTVAIVGATGAGKSTLLSLLSRFHNPTSGQVLIDGQDLRDLKLQSLRRQISIVLQENAIFRSTVWENIAYGCDDFPAGFGPQWLKKCHPQEARRLMDKIVAASKEANAHEFIEKLPEGYHTMVAERGATLSGGQRQRIAIARAMIRQAPLLILDEPTAGLDAESEQLVMEALERLKAGRTTFVIAHHLSTIRRADFIIVVENKRITESGTHHELYQLSNRYRHYYDIQFAPTSEVIIHKRENLLTLSNP